MCFQTDYMETLFDPYARYLDTLFFLSFLSYSFLFSFVNVSLFLVATELYHCPTVLSLLCTDALEARKWFCPSWWKGKNGMTKFPPSLTAPPQNCLGVTQDHLQSNSFKLTQGLAADLNSLGD